MEDEGVVEVPDYDQNGGSEMEAKLYGNELGLRGTCMQQRVKDV